MEEENKKSDKFTPKKRSNAEGIGIGLGVGIAFGVVGFSIATVIPFSAAWSLFLFILYIAFIVLCFVKGEKGIGIGLIITLCIPLLIFGGCLVILSSMSWKY